MVKNTPGNARDFRDSGSIPGLGRFPGGGNGNPHQYSCLENPMDRGVWQAAVHGVAKSMHHTGAEISLETILSHNRRLALLHVTHCSALPTRLHQRPCSLSTAGSSHPRAFALKPTNTNCCFPSREMMVQFFNLKLVLFILSTPCDMRDLSFLTGDRIWPPVWGVWSLSHREVPSCTFKIKQHTFNR